ncbi:hypothetical protein LINPERHAP1_LOCUS24621 [Linum perenne]
MQLLNPNFLPRHFLQTAVGSSLLLPLDHAANHSTSATKTQSQPAEKRKLPSIDACSAFFSKMAVSQLDATYSKIDECRNPASRRLLQNRPMSKSSSLPLYFSDCCDLTSSRNYMNGWKRGSCRGLFL